MLEAGDQNSERGRRPVLLTDSNSPNVCFQAWCCERLLDCTEYEHADRDRDTESQKLRLQNAEVLEGMRLGERRLQKESIRQSG